MIVGGMIRLEIKAHIYLLTIFLEVLTLPETKQGKFLSKEPFQSSPLLRKFSAD
jgi:hypothetical protein